MDIFKNLIVQLLAVIYFASVASAWAIYKKERDAALMHFILTVSWAVLFIILIISIGLRVY